MVITAICATIVWYGFVVTPETNCIIAVVGSRDLDGSQVEVLPKVAADPDRARLSVTLNEANQYSARFFLSSGTYQVRVLKPDGSMVSEATEFVPPGRRWTYDLPHQKAGLGQTATTRPATSR